MFLIAGIGDHLQGGQAIRQLLLNYLTDHLLMIRKLRLDLIHGTITIRDAFAVLTWIILIARPEAVFVLPGISLLWPLGMNRGREKNRYQNTAFEEHYRESVVWDGSKLWDRTVAPFCAALKTRMASDLNSDKVPILPSPGPYDRRTRLRTGNTVGCRAKEGVNSASKGIHARADSPRYIDKTPPFSWHADVPPFATRREQARRRARLQGKAIS
jgi:hypothetical protein